VRIALTPSGPPDQRAADCATARELVPGAGLAPARTWSTATRLDCFGFPGKKVRQGVAPCCPRLQLGASLHGSRTGTDDGGLAPHALAGTTRVPGAAGALGRFIVQTSRRRTAEDSHLTPRRGALALAGRPGALVRFTVQDSPARTRTWTRSVNSGPLYFRATEEGSPRQDSHLHPLSPKLSALLSSYATASGWWDSHPRPLRPERSAPLG
jgi:hypothetical protein